MAFSTLRQGAQRSMVSLGGARSRCIASVASETKSNMAVSKQMPRYSQQRNFQIENADRLISEIVRKAIRGSKGQVRRNASGQPCAPLHGPTAWGMHKFGGASLADAGLYRTCGDILIGESTAGGSFTPTAAVVSAMKGMTDKFVGVVEAATKRKTGEETAKELLQAVVQSHLATARELLPEHPELVEEIAKNILSDEQDIHALLRSVAVLRVVPNSTMEFVAGMGEIWSAQLLCAYLKTKEIPTAWLNARDVLVVEANSSGLGAKGAALDMRVDPNYTESAMRLDTWWGKASQAMQTDKPPIVVVTGFVCSTMEGVPTTLKRSGSDYSATIFARMLKAAHVTLWKNVDGVFSADPNAVPSASPVPFMSYDEAIELAYFGGQVIHPTAMVPSMQDNTPVYVRNVFNPTFAGSKISHEVIEEVAPVKCITSIPNIAMVSVKGGSWASVSRIVSRAMGAMEDAGVKVVLATQACASHSVTVAVDEAEGKRAVKALEAAFELEITRGKIDGVMQEPGYSIMAVVGDGMKDSVGTLGNLTGALAQAGISVHAMSPGTSGRNVAVVIEKDRLQDAMLAVHDELTSKGRVEEEFAGTTSSLRKFVDNASVVDDAAAPKLPIDVKVEIKGKVTQVSHQL